MPELIQVCKKNGFRQTFAQEGNAWNHEFACKIWVRGGWGYETSGIIGSSDFSATGSRWVITFSNDGKQQRLRVYHVGTSCGSAQDFFRFHFQGFHIVFREFRGDFKIPEFVFSARLDGKRCCLRLDPGIGFAKDLEHNLSLLRNCSVSLAENLGKWPKWGGDCVVKKICHFQLISWGRF